jgi:hypothetical protein
MTKTVKLPEDRDTLGMDEIVEDDLSLDELSETEGSRDGGTAVSEDVSDYDGKPKEAPSHAFFGLDRCRSQFQLKNDNRNHIVRVCGGSTDCSRKGHRKGGNRAQAGVYDTIKTRDYVDGILGERLANVTLPLY